MGSVYQTGTENMRDVTKWLTALVPTAAVVGAAGLLAPRLAQSSYDYGTADAWLDDYGAIIAGTAAILVGVAATIGIGALVLATQPVGLNDLLTDERRLSKAFEVGVGVPYYIDSESFVAALRDLHLALMSNSPLADGVAQRPVAAVDDLRAWALQRTTAKRFVIFLATFVLGLILMLGGFVVASSGLSASGAAIDQPLEVRIDVSEAGAEALLVETGCEDAAESTVLAIGGTWDTPVLVIDGPGCDFGATWHPDQQQAVLFFPDD